jgi:hypothetical protein
MRINTNVANADTTTDPRQPRRFEKNRNIALLFPRHLLATHSKGGVPSVLRVRCAATDRCVRPGAPVARGPAPTLAFCKAKEARRAAG